jgi:hypothetical protein
MRPGEIGSANVFAMPDTRASKKKYRIIKRVYQAAGGFGSSLLVHFALRIVRRRKLAS